MPTFTLAYARLNNAAATVELNIEAKDERQAMGQAHEILTAEPGQNAWVLQSIIEAGAAS